MKIRVTLIAAGCLATGAFAADSGVMRTYDGAGIRGSFLARGSGARPAAMGAAFTGIADDASALAWNPGGLGQLSALSAMAQYDVVGAGIGISTLSAAMPVGEAVAGLSVSLLSWGTLDYRNENGEATSAGSLTDAAVSQGWSIRNPAWLGGAGWSGVAVEFVQEARETALVGFSAGSLIPLDDRVTIGWSLLHAGPASEGGPLPRSFRAGSSYHGGPVNAALDLSYGLVDHLLECGAGAEYRPIPAVAARAGWRQDGRGQGIAGLRGVTAGFGLRFDRFALDYAYQPFGDLATTHRISVEYRMPGGRRPARLAPPPVAAGPVKPVGPKRREPVIKLMPSVSGADGEGVPLKPESATPLRPAAGSVTVHAASTGGPVSGVHSASPPSATAMQEPVDDGGTKFDPLLPPPAELETPADPDEGLRGGRRRGGSRPGAGDASPDAPLRGGR